MSEQAAGPIPLVQGKDSPDNDLVLVDSASSIHLAHAIYDTGLPFTAVTWEGGWRKATTVDWESLRGRNFVLFGPYSKGGMQDVQRLGNFLSKNEVSAEITIVQLGLVWGDAPMEGQTCKDLPPDSIIDALGTLTEFTPSRGGRPPSEATLRARELADSGFVASARGTIRDASVKNAVLALDALGISERLRWNEWEHEIQYLNDNKSWTTYDEKSLLSRFMLLAEDKFHGSGYVPGKEAMRDGVSQVAQRGTINPMLEWITRCHEEWKLDGSPWLDRIAADVFKIASPSEYEVEASKLVVLGMVSRALNPGVHFRYMPVLYSHKQGVGKGSFLKALAGGYHSEGLDLDSFDWKKRIQENMLGVSIMELGEIDGLSGKQQRNLKNLITEEYLRGREAYAREAAKRPIQCIFVATTNKSSIFSDSELRRFPVVEIPMHPGIDMSYFTSHLSMFVGHAASVVMDDISRDIALPDHLWTTANESSMEFRRTADLAMYIDEILETLGNPNALSCRELKERIESYSVATSDGESNYTKIEYSNFELLDEMQLRGYLKRRHRLKSSAHKYPVWCWLQFENKRS